MSSSRRTGCPARCGSILGADQPGAGFFQRVVAPLRERAGVLRPGRGGQGVQHRLDRGGAPGRQVPFQPPRPAESPGEADLPVLKPVIAVLVGRGVLAEQLPRNPGQVTQARPRGRRAEQLTVSVIPHIGGQPLSPVSDLPRPRQRHPAAGERGCDHYVPTQAVHPGNLRSCRRTRRLSLPGQPYPRGPVPVAGQAAAGNAERRQHLRVGRGLPGLGYRQRAQAIGL